MIGRKRRRTAPTIRRLEPTEFRDLFADAFGIYASAMGYPKTYIQPRMQLASTHLGYPDMIAFGAFDATTLVGFTYGYRTRPGQWWADEVARSLSRPDADRSRNWLEHAYELCEIHVAPRAQGRGIGRALLNALIAAQPCPVVLLSTPIGPTKAGALYESAGFAVLASRFQFTGDRREFNILGLVVERD